MPVTDLAHPEEDRHLSIEEYKRIQDFPDDWIMAGTLVDQYRQVGNAVLCSLEIVIARILLNSLKEETSIVHPNFPYSRYQKTDELSWTNDTLGSLEDL